MEIIKAIRFVQRNRVFYVCAVPAGKLIKWCKVDEWDPNDPSGNKGYQRAPSMRRKKEIAEFLKYPDSIMPVGGLLNARADNEEKSYGNILNFSAEWTNDAGNISEGWLEISEEDLPLYIIDMQHRLGGFQCALEEDSNRTLEEFPLVVTIADGLDFLEEVEQFDIINTNQKKVRTDLARRLRVMQVAERDKKLSLDQKGKLWEAKGASVVSELDRFSNIWGGKIIPPNASKSDRPYGIIRETSFVTSLKPLLQTPFFSRMDDEKAARFVDIFWTAIMNIWPIAFEYPENYLIQKTPGVFSLHKIAPEVFELARDRGEINIENVQIFVEGLGDEFDVEYWNRKLMYDDGFAQYGGMKGFNILASILRDKLPLLD